MDDRSDPPLFTGSIPARPLPVDFEPIRPPVDDASLRAGVAGIVRIAETGAVVYVASVAKKETGNPEIVSRTSEAARPSAEVRELLINGGVGCWKKYFPNTPIGPEAELGGGFLMWGNQIRVLIEELRALGKAQRGEAKAA
jgi:hypothetical protein